MILSGIKNLAITFLQAGTLRGPGSVKDGKNQQKQVLEYQYSVMSSCRRASSSKLTIGALENDKTYAVSFS